MFISLFANVFILNESQAFELHLLKVYDNLLHIVQLLRALLENTLSAAVLQHAVTSVWDKPVSNGHQMQTPQVRFIKGGGKLYRL